MCIFKDIPVLVKGIQGALARCQDWPSTVDVSSVLTPRPYALSPALGSDFRVDTQLKAFEMGSMMGTLPHKLM